MAQAPPILIYTPGGGVSSPIGSNPPVYSQQGTTALVEDQAYIDVVFGSIQTEEDWVLVACEVVNTTDLEPLNIWPGIITDRSVAGFRIQLNGMPDSDNYYLSWAVSGINVEPSQATTYFLTGSATGPINGETTFTVSLPPSTYVNATVTVTPSEGGLEIGVFSPETVTLTTDSPSATFTFTPALYGDTTITVNNDRNLTDPDDIAFTVLADTYTLSGPSSGVTGVASTDFTVELPVGGVVVGTVTVTPDDASDGVFTPTTLALTTIAPSDTFTYTPASTGAKTISVTNNGGLTNPGNLTYTVTTGLVDGSLVSSWDDSSGNGNNATNSGSLRPTFKTAIVNGKPVVRFSSASSNILNLTTPISGAYPWVTFVVMKPANLIQHLISISGSAAQPSGPWAVSSGDMQVVNRGKLANLVNAWSGAFHVFTGYGEPAASTPLLYVDGTAIVFTVVAASVNSFDFSVIGAASDGDIAEIIQFNTEVGGTDRANIEKYLGTKYAITVAGGSAVQPDTVTGLVGWWKADTLL